MKTTCLTVALLAVGCLGLHAQTPTSPGNQVDQTGVPVPTEYQVVSHGANHRVWQRETYEKLPNGRIVSHKHQYTELATGMYYKDATGNWQESKEEIDTYSSGAIAQQGQYQVIFANNLNSAGSIDLQTPDGKRLKSNILGLAYYDSSSGQSVLIGQIQDSQGELISSNQVIYTNAFSGVNADVRYTYKIGSFEQDVILREQPPAPESFGLNSATTEIQVLTEYLGPPELKAHKPHRDANVDQDISWGAMRIGHGKAFDLDEPHASHSPVFVQRRYATINGRNILTETVPLQNIQPSLSNLPKQAHLKSHRLMTASRDLALPKTPLARAATEPMRLALASPANKGYVLDYVELNSDQENYTFQSDTTYYIANIVNIDGTATIEGGTVVKFDTAADVIYLAFWGDVFCNTAPYRPAIFTSLNDNTLGENISNPDEPLYYYWTGLAGPSSSDVVWHDIRFKYANYGLDGYNLQISDAQFVNCLYPVLDDLAYGGTCSATNILIVNAASAFSGVGFTTVAWQVTASGCTNLTHDMDGYTTSTLALTNSLLVNVQNVGYATLSSNYTAWVTDSGGQILQTAGASSCYLLTNSPYHNAGTANVDPTVLADIATKTTYPPIVYYVPDQYFYTNLNLFPQAQRDTNAQPDLGYHYDPLDYIIGSIFITNATIKLNAGTAVGLYATNIYTYGFAMSDNSQLISQGAPNELNHIVEYNTVQEGAASGWIEPAYGLVTHFNGNKPYVVDSSFTDWSVIAQDAYHLHIPNGYMPALINSQFHGGNLLSYGPTVSLTNCLLERVNVDLEPIDANVTVFQNNEIFGGTFGFYPAQTNCIITDNYFDQVSIPDWLGAYGIPYVGGYNAFDTNCDRLDPAFATDVILSSPIAYQSSFFGNYYQPTNSPLINAGSTNADLLGLYHFTTQTNEMVEGDCIVTIGYHYVATDQYGNPLDSNGNGIPDYIEDTNGNGQPLTITLQAPTNGAFYAEPATIPIQATVFDWRSVVTNVSFHQGGIQINEQTNSTYQYIWPMVAAGVYSVSATAQDVAGANANSSVIGITVTNLCGD